MSQHQQHIDGNDSTSSPFGVKKLVKRVFAALLCHTHWFLRTKSVCTQNGWMRMLHECEEWEMPTHASARHIYRRWEKASGEKERLLATHTHTHTLSTVHTHVSVCAHRRSNCSHTLQQKQQQLQRPHHCQRDRLLEREICVEYCLHHFTVWHGMRSVTFSVRVQQWVVPIDVTILSQWTKIIEIERKFLCHRHLDKLWNFVNRIDWKIRKF